MYGDGRVYLRGGTYWIAFNRYGEEVRMSAGTDNKTKAKKKLRDELKKARTDAWVEPQDRKITIAELVEDLQKFYTAKGKTKFAADTEARWRLHLKATFDHVPAFRLTTTMLREYKATRFAEEDKPAVATVNRELQVIRRAFKLAADHEPPKVARVPKFELESENNAVLEFFTSEQMDKIRAAASAEGQEWRALIELAYALGWRRGELLGLRVDGVDLLAGTLRIPTSKNGQPREAALTPRLVAFIQPLLTGKDTNARVFATIDADSFRYGWRRIAKAASVKKFHSFRRTSARDKRAVGVAASVIMEEQGWTSEAMFRRYAITTREDKLEGQRKLEEYQSRTRTNLGQSEVAAKRAAEQVQ
jgi:integrase